MSFWEHLDALRSVLVRIVCVSVVTALVAFCFKDELFTILLAPKEPDFMVYRLFRMLGERLALPSMVPENFHIQLVSTQLTSQFMAHMNVSLYAGLLVAAPYILYQLYHFVAPALYGNERRYAVRLVVWSYLLFMLGVLLSYFLLFPLTLRFLAGYVVSPEVQPMLTLDSYIDTLMMLSLTMGIVFEVPVLSWLLAKSGILKAWMLAGSRRYAIVVVLVVGAVITPTSDIFTLLLVSIPLYALFETSVFVVKKTEEHRKKPVVEEKK